MPDAGTPNFSAWRRAASGRRSATIRTSRSGNVRMFARYCSLIVPAPMTPTPTGPLPLIGRGR